jgi:hypothetical protein
VLGLGAVPALIGLVLRTQMPESPRWLLRHGRYDQVVIMIDLDFFIASFAVGVGGTGWTLQGEVFPTEIRGQAAAFAAMVDWLANFALIEVFPA